MCSGTSIALIASALIAAGSTAYQASQTSSPKMPKAEKPPIPSGPATLPDKANFAKERGVTPFPSPEGVTFGAGLTAEQQRSQIATQALAGNSGTYKTPEVSKFYKDLAFRTLTDEQGNPTGTPLGIERQYIRDVLGQTPQQGTTSSFLSALLRS